MNKIICAENTADGARHFVVESKEAFDALVRLSDNGTDEAEMWGGFEFDVDTSEYDEDTDEGFFDADGTTVEQYLAHDAITLKQVRDAEPEIDDDADDDEYEDAYEGAYASIMG